MSKLPPGQGSKYTRKRLKESEEGRFKNFKTESISTSAQQFKL
jgi:hypothetical protein